MFAVRDTRSQGRDLSLSFCFWSGSCIWHDMCLLVPEFLWLKMLRYWICICFFQTRQVVKPRRMKEEEGLLLERRCSSRVSRLPTPIYREVSSAKQVLNRASVGLGVRFRVAILLRDLHLTPSFETHIIPMAKPQPEVNSGWWINSWLTSLMNKYPVIIVISFTLLRCILLLVILSCY